jgi:hypothetical protein
MFAVLSTVKPCLNGITLKIFTCKPVQLPCVLGAAFRVDVFFPTVPENLRKSEKRKNAPNPLFHSCFIEDGFVQNHKF